MKRFLAKVTKNEKEEKNRNIWQGFTHGFHSVGGNDSSGILVLAQREQIGRLEVWLFGVFDETVGRRIAHYLRSNIFGKNHNEQEFEKKAEEIMEKTYLFIGEKIHKKAGAHNIAGFATALVMNGEKFVAANLGKFKVVIFRDGMASQIGEKHQRTKKGQQSLLEKLHVCRLVKVDGITRSSGLTTATQKVGPETEYLILGSEGIWEVMSKEEAMQLISLVEDAQEAAELLTNEAVKRGSKSTISCVVLHFH